MHVLSPQIEGFIERSSWIRKMFETGRELKAKHGATNVFDFSLGNPDLPPPGDVGSALTRVAKDLDKPLALGYMPNAGYPHVREALAKHLSREQGTDLSAAHVLMTCGAAGGLNAFFRAVLEPGDQVVCPAPYFVEYGFYVSNFGGELRPVKSKPLTFDLDLAAIEGAITDRTRAVLVNSPNNPCGQIYSAQEMQALTDILVRRNEGRARPIFLVSDEPYRFLAYDGVTVPPLLPLYPYTIVVGSFSKSLSMAGERVGYLAANPAMPGVDELMNGVILTNRILGFVNAPALGQLLLGHALGHEVDIAVYDGRRKAMARVLEDAGIEFSMPKGAFYFFPKAPTGEDDSAFCRMLMDELVLGVPGTGFGYPGFFRLALCVGEDVIARSAEGFKRAAARARA